MSEREKILSFLLLFGSHIPMRDGDDNGWHAHTHVENASLIFWHSVSTIIEEQMTPQLIEYSFNPCV